MAKLRAFNWILKDFFQGAQKFNETEFAKEFEF